MRTPLTYYGGKQRLASQIVPLMPAHRVYLEPFAGGAAVLFAKPRAEREVLNDLNGQIQRFWRAVRDQPEELARAITLTPYSRAEWEQYRNPLDRTWRRPSATVDESIDDVEAARQLIVSIDQSFSRSQHGWSPPSILFDRRGRWQAGVWQNLPDKILAAVDRLSGVALECYDAIELIPKYDVPDSLIYCDPPYPLETRLAPDRMYACDDDGTLWPRLLEVLKSIETAAVIVSGYAGDFLDELGWRMVPLEHKRTVTARRASKLSAAPEVVWLSPQVPEVVPSLFDGHSSRSMSAITEAGLR